ncbi:hypothetical protein RhiirA4_429748 [Rhizophagus irregularis]|uniref:Uncharacterized protein n=1 Tax=Rhizophagus irregularis TaxID=588596 RepID=A0A2I1HI33_9GLOM|nr:hypothetical protein RhiirA4_429748 [Rhizophagus irregularis]
MIDIKKRLSINVTYLEAEKPKQMTGANMLYNIHKGTSYALLDFNSLRKDNTQLQVFTNNKRIIERYKSPYEITSDRKNANVKFHIFKYLTVIMLVLLLSKGTRTKYFNRIRFLLLKKYQSIINQLSSDSPKNNETTTYIRFSVRQTTWYFRFQVPCNICSQLCAIVLSKDRRVCWKHKKEVIQRPPKIPLDKVIFKEKFHESVKRIFSAQRGISYMKQFAFEGRKSYEQPSAKYDFAMIRTFKEDTLPKKKVAMKEDYDMMYHIFVNCKLTATEAVDYRYKCSRNDIEYDMNIIDQWYNESLQALERRKEIKRQFKRDKCNNRF